MISSYARGGVTDCNGVLRTWYRCKLEKQVLLTTTKEERFFVSIRALLQSPSDGGMTYLECTPKASPRDPSGKSEWAAEDSRPTGSGGKWTLRPKALIGKPVFFFFFSAAPLYDYPYGMYR